MPHVSISLSISADSAKVIVILDGEGLGSALIQVTISGRLIMRRMALSVRPIQPLTKGPIAPSTSGLFGQGFGIKQDAYNSVREGQIASTLICSDASNSFLV